MTSRFAFAAALVAVMLTTSGCLPQPEPEPTPRFTSEAEAFAAAEATYRAYVDALNQVDLSDPETFEAVYAWTTGDALRGERKSLTKMHADGWSVSGATEVVSVDLGGYISDTDTPIVLATCADVSDVGVTDANGDSMVSDDRPTIQASLVSMVRSDVSRTGLLIEKIEGGDHSCSK